MIHPAVWRGGLAGSTPDRAEPKHHRRPGRSSLQPQAATTRSCGASPDRFRSLRSQYPVRSCALFSVANRRVAAAQLVICPSSTYHLFISCFRNSTTYLPAQAIDWD